MADITTESKFTPTKVVDENKEKDWPVNLGMLDWDNTRIVFTKRSLIEFLKYTGTTVDTNFQNIQKLPKYATFGKFSGPAPGASAATSSPDATSTQVQAESDEFKPTRRVRTVPGGASSDIFSHLDDGTAVDEPAKATRSPEPVEDNAEQDEGLPGFTSSAKPSRRVRSNPGGNSSIGSFFESPDEHQKAIPSRRVRQNPGGQDSIGSAPLMKCQGPKGWVPAGGGG
ncbi:hypothetical protein HDZ31DRAFT_83883 [Schizophyllum fasciatum]